jgi:hypothetical protein
MSTQVLAIEDAKTGYVSEVVYEHPFVVRLFHWVNAISLFVVAGSRSGNEFSWDTQADT